MKNYLLILLFGFIYINIVCAQPVNNDCQNAITLPISSNWCSTVAQFTNVSATPSAFGAATCFGAASNDVWFSFTSVGTDVNIIINGNQFPSPGGTLINPQVALYSGNCSGTITELQCESSLPGNNIVSMYKGGLVIGQTYLIRVQGSANNTGTFEICA